MIAILLFVFFVVGCSLSFLLGMMIQKDNDEKTPARIIRPANITIEKHVHVTEYNVVNSESLELDFPKDAKSKNNML